MQIFWVETTDGISGKLNEAEAKHCIQVLRHQPGDHIHAVDGKGTYYRATIKALQKREVLLSLEERIANWGESPYFLEIAISPLTKKDRFEWFLEKAVELGVHSIVPIACQHTQKARLPKVERMEMILLTALKQAKRSRLPQLHPLQPLASYLENTSVQLGFIGWCEAEEAFSAFHDPVKSANSIHFLIGPEGDFSEKEVQQAIQHQFHPVSLGTNRLRTETAGMYALSAIKTLKGY